MLQHHLRRRRTVTTKGGLTLPRAGLILYLPLPNAYLPIDWDEELGWESPMLGYQATPGDDALFAAAPQLYDGDADSPLVLSDAEVEALTNGYNIVFSTAKGLAVYDPYTTTDAVINKAHKYIKDLPLYDDTPTAYFNGVDITGSTSFDSGTLGTNPGQWVLDNTGVLVNAGVDVPAMQGMRLDGTTWRDTTIDGTPILPSVNQATRTGSTDFSSFTPSTTFKKYTRTDPLVMPGYLSEPARTNYCLNSTAPVTQTTASLATGTYCLWVEGAGSFQASAGTAAATGGWGSSAVAGTPITFTITTAGTVVLTKTGTVTFVQLELGAFPTSRIVTADATVTRAGTVLTYPTVGKIRSNNIAFRMTVVPRASGQSGPFLFGAYIDSSNELSIRLLFGLLAVRKKIAGISTELTIGLTHAKAVPIDIVFVGTSSIGMRVASRFFSGGVWGAWVNGTLLDSSGAKAPLPLGSTFNLGSSRTGIDQFTGNIELFDTLFIPTGITDPLAWAKAQWGIS